MTMGPNNLAKIKAANEKLLRLDPDYRHGVELNKKAAARRSRMIYPCEVRIPFMNGIGAEDDFDAQEGALLAGFEEDLDGIAIRDGDQKNRVSASQSSPNSNGKHPWRSYRPSPSLTKKDKPAKLAADKKPHVCRQGGSGPKAKAHTHAGETMTLAAWAEKLDMNLGTLRNRLTQGWTLEAALTIAPGALMGEKTHRGRSKTFRNASGTDANQRLELFSEQAFFQ